MGRPTGPHIVAAALLLIACGTPGCSGPDEILRSGEGTGITEGRVIRVVDGDTAIIRVAGIDHRVRLIGVDAPESTREVEPFGEEASEYAKRELSGRRVWLETDVELRDRYDRVLAYIWLAPPEDRSDSEIREAQFNARLLLDGYASVSTFPPNVRYVDEYTRYAREARETGRGLWSRSHRGAAPGRQGERDSSNSAFSSEAGREPTHRESSTPPGATSAIVGTAVTPCPLASTDPALSEFTSEKTSKSILPAYSLCSPSTTGFISTHAGQFGVPK